MRMNSMLPNQMDPNFQQQMLRMNPDLRQKALQNHQQNGFRGYVVSFALGTLEHLCTDSLTFCRMNPQQMQMAMQRNAILQQNMRRDQSSMDMNGQRPRTPSSADHAPSPKRARMDANGFNPQQMMPNGRPPPGMPPAMMDGTAQANALLANSGINPGNLSDSQFASFQSQQPSVQQKSIQVYAQNMGKNRNEGTSFVASSNYEGLQMLAEMGMGPGGPDYYANAQMMRGGPMPPNGAANGPGGEHALQDYQMQLMLLEQQNKKRLLMARQEQDGPGQPGIPFAAATGMSPQGSRGGPSPGPGAERRGTPKLGQQGMDGSPLPDGSLRGSPATMQNFVQGQPPDLYNSMNPGARPPPSSNPAFAGQFPQQAIDQMRQSRMPNGNWQQGPPGHAPMAQQATNPQQPPQMGTPQQRNEMPPPQAPSGPAANGRSGSDETPPTPQPANKANPKPKKDTKKVKFPLC